MQSFEYSVFTRASRCLAWEVFSNWRRWHTFANVYGGLRWSGTPWNVGSRLQIEILRPVNAVIDHVITACEPARKVGWLDHALGITMEQWVLFDEEASGLTRIHTFGEFLGAPSAMVIGGQTVEQMVTDFTRTWYENFRLVCDQLTGPGSRRSCIPTNA